MRNVLLYSILSFFVTLAYAGNDTLTIRQAFNLKVGDSLTYRQYSRQIAAGFPQTPITWGYTGFKVSARTNYTDSIQYQLKYFNPDTTAYWTVYNLDSAVMSFPFRGFLLSKNDCMAGSNVPDTTFGFTMVTDSAYGYSDSSFLNRQGTDFLLNQTVPVTEVYPIYDTITFTEKLGVKSRSRGQSFYNGITLITQICGYNLVYYRTDSAVWTDTLLYYTTGIPEEISPAKINIYPNPASNELNITGLSSKAEGLLLYSSTGTLVSATAVFGRHQLSVDVSKLSAGIYIMVVKGFHYQLNRKVVIAR